MSKQTPPNPFGEKTVVQVRTPSPTQPQTPEVPNESGAGEKTVVHARSNLKATFDERTVVRPSNAAFPTDMPPLPKAESPKIPDAPKAEAMKTEAPKAAAPKTEAPRIPDAPKVEAQIAVAQPAPKQEPSFTSFTPSSHADPQTGGAVQIKTSEVEEPVKKAKKEKAPREPRAPLNQRTKLMIAGGAAVAILAAVFMMAGGDTSPEASQTRQAGTQVENSGEESMASQQPSEMGAPKIQQLSGPPASSTTDVLNRFDRAAQRAQERAEQYSRSGSGF